MSYKGKIVVYRNVDGGFCYGRIKDEVVVNTMEGEKAAFILEDRIVGYLCDAKGKVEFPRNQLLTSAICQDGKEFFLRTTHVPRDSILRLDAIDVEKDIMAFDDLLGQFTDDELFVIILVGKVTEMDDRVFQSFFQLLLDNKKSSDDYFKFLKDELEKRMGNKG